jgi:hypothetical protein
MPFPTSESVYHFASLLGLLFKKKLIKKDTEKSLRNLLVLFLNIECVVRVAWVGIHMLYEAICIIDNNRYKGGNTAGRACRLRKVRRAGAYPLGEQLEH